MTDVARILSAIEQGDPQAAEQLLPLVVENARRKRRAKHGGEFEQQDCRFLFPRRQGGSREVLLECVSPMTIRGRL